jgi:ataxia telangiectasia mutated family protein
MPFSFERSNSIISARRTLFSTLSKSTQLRDLLRVSIKDSRVVEAKSLLSSASLARHHEDLQSSLGAATYLSTLVQPCKEIGVRIEAISQFESSNVMWEQGEMTASVRMIRETLRNTDLNAQAIPVGRAELLAKLSHRISEARQEKPDEIIENYLIPAKKDLHKHTGAREAGQVFHEFASFCDQQLQNPDILEDLRRIRHLRDRKLAEVHDLERMIKGASVQGRERDQLKNHRQKAKQWFELDNAEYERLIKSRQALLNQSLENYLLCLKVCDTYDSDAIRFSALWLEHSEDESANKAVSESIQLVASRKFATLMNQWTSRLLESSSLFQQTLSQLVLRICIEHPYHGMFHIFASSKTKGGKDQMALSRHAAACQIVEQLKNNRRTGHTWIAVHNTNIDYVRFAAEKSDDSGFKAGAKIALRKSQHGPKLEQDVINLKVPPPTITLELRADCDYSNVPSVAKFQPEFSIASGISMPKILTAIGTDGKKYKQLFKSGNDDLRQDAIMEQVFEQVNNLLKVQRDTRQRNLGIRTYKVLPLTATAGVIEFVPHTIPLNDFLMPAHQKHFPADLKPSACRKAIAEAQTKPTEQRVRTYRQVCEKFHPVLRYFFMERFEAPDDWFARRLAYTRSTAAISILGHILGLGDRHGHNILLDEKTGEVVHIDLGIAFEQGRVLPVPELVPFRLTRDLVDGMGITKTEGVFRRCCEFTLAALRNESYSIMTILDVLRYDPLYSWSLSPLRLKRLQDDQAEAGGLGKDVSDGMGGGEKKDEQGEADRALTVVSKKLSKTLSVTATVNELIQQATDERNLALLFAGWAAYT